ncbi:hypothetical protein L226DRAFT_482950 [Lentinus tigrinus ALCF2SS1-7]|uniref:BTB domain-containing protein n=1 Tax=Lentinus tigrinus ALCF2SS1-6 TaxID=1328759 RepID=A0A5C2RPY4_9APHY|nr:hypothetical protein L227DRAFT_535741 [Lentinus tigrinus ALCF2SS1-6]RPD76778.1 hypothetical protein L226DRAFT_482950 [Lentinus tigrinus ALCF2SS1-7]
MFASTSSKRPREDDVEASPAQTKKTCLDAYGFVRDGEFWYQDGTIILVARNVQFRVYKGILADHSSVFADMFSIPQPASPPAGALPLDCPVVYLDDIPEDIRYILRALYPKTYASLVSVEPQIATFDAISAYVRLGHKYQMDHLLAQALDFLRHYFPTDFEKWKTYKDYVPESWTPVQAIGVVNISRLTACGSILPAALSVCCTLEGSELLQGFERKDGTKEKLTEEDTALCFTALNKLTQASARVMLEAFAPFTSPECLSRKECQRGVQALLYSYTDDSRTIADHHPFRPWSYYTEGSRHALIICATCQRILRSRLENGQRRTWNQLPQLLGITVEGWSGQADEGEDEEYSESTP